MAYLYPAGPYFSRTFDAPPATKARIAEHGRQFLLISLRSVLSGVADGPGASGADFFDPRAGRAVSFVAAPDDFPPGVCDDVPGDEVGEEEVEVGGAPSLELEEPEGGELCAPGTETSADATAESSEMSFASSSIEGVLPWVGERNHRDVIRLAAP